MWAANNLRPAYLAQGIVPPPTLSCGMSIGAGRKQVIPLPPAPLRSRVPKAGLPFFSQLHQCGIACLCSPSSGGVGACLLSTHPSLSS